MIRKMKKSDKKACVGLLQQLYPHLSLKELETKFFWGEEAMAYVLIDFDKVAGVAIWEDYDYLPDNSHLLELSAIVIDSLKRKIGYGRQLFHCSLWLIKEEMKVSGMHILVTKDSAGFYQRILGRRIVKTPPLEIGGIHYISLLCKA